jgi:uncharacterized protein YnzC (UPF0291/DUF896 family)
MEKTSRFVHLLTLLLAGSLGSVYADPVTQPTTPKTDAQITAVSVTSPAPAPAPVRKRTASPEALKKRELAMLRKSVTLTPDEESKVTPIISNYVDTVQLVKNDARTTTAEKKAKRKELHDQYITNIKAVLTPDQAKTWETANAERIARLRAKKSNPPAADSPSQE